MTDIILGLNAFHADSSACILIDGHLVAAAEEERFNRVKHWSGFPNQAISYCLESSGADMSDVSLIALNRDPNAALARRAWFAARGASPKLIRDRLRNRTAWTGIAARVSEAFGVSSPRIVNVEHHEAHLASAFYCSPYDDAAMLAVDGSGDFTTTSWGRAGSQTFDVTGRIHFPHSLGVLYQALTQYLGFPHFGDEYKVMGLAPYGEPRVAALSALVDLRSDGGFRLNLRFFRHAKADLNYSWDGVRPQVDALFTPALEILLGPARQPNEPLTQRHFDIAATTQSLFQEALRGLAARLQHETRQSRLVIAGGCGANSVTNGQLLLQSSFSEIYAPPATGDAGGAIGSAILACEREGRGFERDSILACSASWGPEFGAVECQRAVDEHRAVIAAAGCGIHLCQTAEECCELTASAIADGHIVGWFQGRMEWGPRALGNRSIVADPRRPDMRDVLNSKIKRRESFRPFAPSILRDHVSEWFEIDAEVPFMSAVLPIRSEKRDAIPAVTHVDGSGRLQTVSKLGNGIYYDLISAFHHKTGVPMVLNTSFNENEPVVCTPAEAIDCFLRTEMDLIVLGPLIITRR